MDEKTEELRDIFMQVSDDAEVTEKQSESRGSLVDDVDVEGRLVEIIGRMRDDLGFDTTLDDQALATVVRGFYEGDTDAEIARELGEETVAKTVGRARIDLHLLRDRDEDAPFPLEDLEEALDSGFSVSEAAAELGVSESTVRRYRRVLDAKRAIRQVNDRYRDDFEDLLEDRGLAEQMTRDVLETGLEGAIEGQETDTQM
ncbi:MAG: helix-turn-helix domain-containing protein [Halobacteriota archaeon]